MASCVIQRPNLRILLLSTTNRAVDQALVAVDRELESLGGKFESRRSLLCRLGSHFHSEYYKDREHLIPIQDKELLRQLRQLELAKPGPDGSAEELALWHTKYQQLREKIRAQMATLLSQKSIIAMTILRAASLLSDLSSTGQFDLLIFDEASQISLASCLILLPLANRFLFAGDDRQLSPIVVSNHPKAKLVLGSSPFKYRGFSNNHNENTVMLNEQSRMAPPIGNAISEVFYYGKLRVADDALRQPKWLQERTFRFADIPEDRSITCISVDHQGLWSKKYRGLVRLESATKIAEIVEEAINSKHISPDNLIVLTPFRAQRVLIKNCLYHKGIRSVKISTVHRFQGSEALVVTANLNFCDYWRSKGEHYLGVVS
jgi:DNA replication ATP-dependent helicase Dna2